MAFLTPTEYTTVVDVEFATVTETLTASTETQLFVVSTTTTASTEILVVPTTKVVENTQTVVKTVQTTQLAVNWRRQAATTQVIPDYASQCPSWEKYVSACKCAGVAAVTVSVEAQSTTTTADAISILASTNTPSVLSETTTTSTTQTVTSVAPLVLQTQAVSAFKALATDFTAPACTCGPTYRAAPRAGCSGSRRPARRGRQRRIRTCLPSTVSGAWCWRNIPPSTASYAAYINTADGSAGSSSRWPQADVSTNVDARVASGTASYVFAGVDTVTNRLYLDGGGRKNILLCGAQVWLSTGLGNEVNGGQPCTVMRPVIVIP
ncbi:hypothetical protein B0T24DRAFT_664853 [Lasiosphaeria ovina]|uniref:Uncharacterized protein n=1 Tax=Lasiosphaeria ovina TaxID=92902 RepID=A0AAE0N9Z8_9PEZI|nr:hypothetical protein B0T24DRAFT_664853 [Lasiosphaeria ovina]